jgi:hypothetical protein
MAMLPKKSTHLSIGKRFAQNQQKNRIKKNIMLSICSFLSINEIITEEAHGFVTQFHQEPILSLQNNVSLGDSADLLTSPARRDFKRNIKRSFSCSIHCRS